MIDIGDKNWNQITDKEWMAMNQILAIHIFGYRWILFTYDKKVSDPFPNRPATLYSLQQPADWVLRHGGKLVSNPEPGVEWDIDIPQYHTREEWVPRLMAEMLKRDSEQHIIVYQTKHGYCAGNLRHGMMGQLGFYPSISMALVVYVLHVLKLETKPVHQP